MGTMDCKEFSNQLGSWMEGEQPPDSQAHLRICPRCRRTVEDLSAIQAVIPEWAGTELDPPARVWTSLRAQLEQEGLIRDGRRRGWLESIGGMFTGLPRPALASGYLAVLVAAAFALNGPIHNRINQARWLEGTNNSTTPLSAQLNSVEKSTVSPLQDSNPIVTASLHKNLAIVDNYISLCEKSVNEEPQNEIARDYLYEAYQQKADLLAQMSERGELDQ
jgi:hypothetical protein